jgi:hypothetical protein
MSRKLLFPAINIKVAQETRFYDNCHIKYSKIWINITIYRHLALKIVKKNLDRLSMGDLK